jgi:hypothetical protein
VVCDLVGWFVPGLNRRRGGAGRRELLLGFRLFFVALSWHKRPPKHRTGSRPFDSIRCVTQKMRDSIDRLELIRVLIWFCV